MTQFPRPLFAADATSGPTGNATGGATVDPVVKRKSPAAFNRAIASQLQEAEEIAATASDARFATMLETEYDIAPADVAELKAMIAEARQKFGLADSNAGAGEADTVDKDKAEDELISALRRIQTGARLTFPDSAGNQARYFIGTDLEAAEPQLVQIATTVLQNLATETLKSVTPAKVQAVQAALANWQTALATQGSTKGASRQDRLDGQALLDHIEPMARQIKIAADGEFSYSDPVNRPTRKLFHIPETRPYVYTPRDE